MTLHLDQGSAARAAPRPFSEGKRGTHAISPPCGRGAVVVGRPPSPLVDAELGRLVAGPSGRDQGEHRHDPDSAAEDDPSRLSEGPRR